MGKGLVQTFQQEVIHMANCYMKTCSTSLFISMKESESESEVAQPCPTLCHPMAVAYQAPPSVEFFQARVLEWIAFAFCRGSSPPRDWTQVSRTASRHFAVWATREAPFISIMQVKTMMSYHLTPARMATVKQYFLNVCVYACVCDKTWW